MKKTIYCTCIMAMLSFTLMGCGSTTPEPPADNVETVNYTITREADYIATDPKDMFTIADVVVEGSFGNPIGSYVNDASFPVTQREFTVTNTHKGDVNDEKITVEYYGGTVSMSSYLDSLTEEQIEKRGIDYSAAEAVKMTVSYEATKESVSIDKEDTYMLFLSYDKENDRYFILCDTYGACKTDHGLIYSLADDAYIEVDFE